MRVLCLGDSNTYGYDPRSYLGGRYPAESRWVDLLSRETGWEFLNTGENGLAIPQRSYEMVWFRRTLADSQPVDGMLIMLGGNDLLQGADAKETARRMEDFLAAIPLPRETILLIAPPPMRPGAWITEPRLLEDSERLGKEYRTLAERTGVRFADAGRWNIAVTFDGVHFTEEGHRTFAAELSKVLREETE